MVLCPFYALELKKDRHDYFLILRDSNIVLEWTGYRTLPEKVWSLKFASQTWAHFHYLGKEKVALFTLVFLHITWVSRGGYPQSISLNIWGFPGSSVVKNTPANAGDAGYGRFDPWVGKISWRRKWQPTPIFLPGKPHEQGSLAVYSPWGHKESDMTTQYSGKVLDLTFTGSILLNLWWNQNLSYDESYPTIPAVPKDSSPTLT